MEDLICQAQTIIEPILGYYRRRGTLASEECDDILSIVRLRVIAKLRQVAAKDSEVIVSFNGYVARLTYNAVKDVFRARNPQRTLFKKRLHDAIGRDPRFVVDSASGAAVCRLASDRGDPVALSSRNLRPLPASQVDAVEVLLRTAGGPLLLNDLVNALYGTLNEHPPDRDVAATAATPLVRLEQRQDLERLWREILQLPVPQRVALLMNLRSDESGNVLALLVLIGIATFDALAAALEMRPEELAGMWGELPLDDLTIAARLGMTRQQVINLRKSARKRLENRTRGE